MIWYYTYLKECPFCRNENLSLSVEPGDFYNGFIARIDCLSCGGTQEWFHGTTIKEACDKASIHWNTRKRYL